MATYCSRNSDKSVKNRARATARDGDCLYDRPTTIRLKIRILRFSAGSPPLTGSGIVRIIVLDVNDHNPEFTRQDYKATVMENMPAGTWVTKPHATDQDEGVNAKIR